MNKNFKVYRSSAGSGKTYALSLNYIVLALEGSGNSYINYYKRILAITFTNKAAAEMKERILRYLFILSEKEDIDNILEYILKETDLEKNEVYKRAKKVYHHILHNYSDLSVSTIDTFTSRIIRTFARDLGISYNFNIILDNNKIIQPVIALLLSKVSKKGGDLTNSLVNFALSKTNEGKNSNIEKDLEQFSHELFKENAFSYIDEDILTIDQCMSLRKKLHDQFHQTEEQIYKLRKDVLSYFNNHDINEKFFIRGSYFNFFNKHLIRIDHKFKLSTLITLIKNIESDKWYAKSSEQKIKDKIDSCKEDLKQYFQKILFLLKEYFSVKAILKNIYSISVLNEIRSDIIKYKSKNNIEQLSEFNKKINSIISNQPAAFIYERIGERYNHYLIDEFQDTSALQWQNLLPLIIESIDYGKSIIVGDAKQSIYRWRGGQIEQFLALPNLNNIQHIINSQDWRKKLNYHYQEYKLSSNFRSRKNIVDFNNKFFLSAKSLLAEDLKQVYDNHSQNTQVAKSGGYVHIELFENKKNDYRLLILDRILEEIKALVQVHKCKYKDIAILCNSSKRINLVANYLTINDIPIVSEDGLLLSSSDEVNFLIAVLYFLNDQNNLISKTAIIIYLQKNNKFHDLDLHLLISKSKNFDGFHQLLKKININLDINALLNLQLYEMIERLIYIFKIENNLFIQFFLDFVFTYVREYDNNLFAFLKYWNENENKETIVTPAATDAVQIMTIHKSKGLAFNNVFIPFNWQDGKNTYDFWIKPSKYFNYKIPNTLVSSNKNLEFSYFQKEQAKEEDFRFLDNLNKLYVATTRAKNRLYIFSKQHLEKKDEDFYKKGNLNSLLFNFTNNYPYILGEQNKIEIDTHSAQNIFTIKSRNKLNWRDILTIKSSDDWDNIYARDWGKLVHNVLADITYIEDKDRVLDNLLKSGLCTREEYIKIEKCLKDLFSSIQVCKYFNNCWNVFTEKQILDTKGRTYIPDRLLFSKKNDKVIVIDFKTGEEDDKHKKQIIEYANVLNSMGYQNVERILIYINKKIKIKII